MAQMRGTSYSIDFKHGVGRGCCARTLFAYLACDDIQGGRLLPKGFWKKVLDNNLDWITENFVHGQSAKERIFFSGTSKSHMGWWQEDYLCGVLAMAVRLGFSDWLPVLKWKIQSNINRLNGTSGWPRTHPTMYFTQFFEGVVTPARRNIGNGSPGIIGYSDRSNPEFGEWSIEFADSSNFAVYRPGHIANRTGQVGREFTSGYGPAFTINPARAFCRRGPIYHELKSGYGLGQPCARK